MSYLVDKLPYDPQNPEAIYSYAKKLEGSKFRDACSWVISEESTGYGGNKGHLGQYLEKNYFLYELNSDQNPDFKEAGVELKVTPLKKLKNGHLGSKERIVLNIINYMEVVKEDWNTSSFLHKNSLLLLIFYLFESDKDRLDYLIKFVTLWEYCSVDLEIIRQDWERIVAKIRDGHAHELSEGDSLYLGACTKGITSASSLRDQPHSTIKAKQRAFCLKQKYVNYIISSTIAAEMPTKGIQNTLDVEPFIKDISELKGARSFEEIILDRLSIYSGQTVDEIHELVGGELNNDAKGYYASLALRMLGLKKSKIEEFEKGNVDVKIIRLNQNATPKESMSFPYFKYKEIVEEKWDNSTLLNTIDKKFFFVIYQEDEFGILWFKKGMFWTIPSDDLKKVERVWKETVSRIISGRAADLPRISDSEVCHVRPHARNKEDTCETPDGQQLIKKSFWLNAKYLKEQVANYN